MPIFGPPGHAVPGARTPGIAADAVRAELDNGPGPDRVRRLLTTVLLPAAG